MSTIFSNSASNVYLTRDGITIRGNSTRDGITTLEAALRARRAARAAYGAALVTPDYHLPQAERDARYAELRADIAAAEATLAEALDALEALL